MNRRQLTLIIVLNALISLAMALTVAWVFEARRPDPEELVARLTPVTAPQPAATFTPTGLLMPVASMSVRALIGMVQASETPGN